MKHAYILVDFENVQPAKMGALDASAFKIIVFHGAKQKMTFGLAKTLQPMGTDADYVEIEGSGRNALDMHIAYYIGRLAAKEPGASFHIVSKDKDYDPLIAHLAKQKIAVHRWTSASDIPHARHTPAKPAPQPAAKSTPKPAPKATAPAARAAPARSVLAARTDEVVANLEKRARARPSTLKALTSTIKSHFRRTPINDAEVEAILAELERRGAIMVSDGKVSYHLE